MQVRFGESSAFEKRDEEPLRLSPSHRMSLSIAEQPDFPGVRLEGAHGDQADFRLVEMATEKGKGIVVVARGDALEIVHDDE